jgi:hypothetical protein
MKDAAVFITGKMYLNSLPCGAWLLCLPIQCCRYTATSRDANVLPNWSHKSNWYHAVCVFTLRHMQSFSSDMHSDSAGATLTRLRPTYWYGRLLLAAVCRVAACDSLARPLSSPHAQSARSSNPAQGNIMIRTTSCTLYSEKLIVK